MKGRRVATFENLERAGDYFGPTPIEDEGEQKRAIWFLLPTHAGRDVFERPTRGSGLHMVTEPPWSFRECPDGSLEIRASILCGAREPEGPYWHGFLDEGHEWREA